MYKDQKLCIYLSLARAEMWTALVEEIQTKEAVQEVQLHSNFKDLIKCRHRQKLMIRPLNMVEFWVG